MQTGHPNSHNIKLVKLCLHTSHDRGCRWNKKVQGAFPHYLIAVHEEADDECAHAQPIADIILLRYRGAFLTLSSEKTRALPKMESWVAAGIDSCFRSTPSFFLTSEMQTENSLLGKIEVGGGRTRTVIPPGSDGNGAFVSAVTVKGSIL
jgi:hypothetical protein